MWAKVGNRRANFNLAGEAGVARLAMRKLTRNWNTVTFFLIHVFKTWKKISYTDAKETNINENARFIVKSHIFRLAHREDFNKKGAKNSRKHKDYIYGEVESTAILIWTGFFFHRGVSTIIKRFYEKYSGSITETFWLVSAIWVWLPVCKRPRLRCESCSNIRKLWKTNSLAGFRKLYLLLTWKNVKFLTDWIALMAMITIFPRNFLATICRRGKGSSRRVKMSTRFRRENKRGTVKSWKSFAKALWFLQTMKIRKCVLKGVCSLETKEK